MRTIAAGLLLLVLSTLPVAADPPPANDECANRIPVAIFGVIAGTTEFATIDSAAGECISDDEGDDTTITAPGVWYSVIGNGNQLQATTCPSTDPLASADYDGKISVYCPDCATLTCVKANDDEPDCSQIRSSEVNWCSQAGVEYQLLIHGYETHTGNFDLAVNDLGPCEEDPVDCGASIAHNLATPAVRGAFGRNVFCKATKVTDTPVTLDELVIYRTNGSVATTVTDVTIPPLGVASIAGDFSSHQYYHCEATATQPGNTEAESAVLRLDVLEGNNSGSGASGDEPEVALYADPIGSSLTTPAIRSAFGRDVFCTATNTTDTPQTVTTLAMYRTNGAVAATASNVVIPPHAVASLRGDFSTHQEYHCTAQVEPPAGVTPGAFNADAVLLRVEVIANNNALSGAED
jgi:hypothetical protein